MWNSDLVKRLQAEYKMPSDYYRDCLNFNIIEVTASGMICEVDAKIDEEGSFKKDGLLIKYKMTSLGMVLLNDLMHQVRPRKGE